MIEFYHTSNIHTKGLKPQLNICKEQQGNVINNREVFCILEELEEAQSSRYWIQSSTLLK